MKFQGFLNLSEKVGLKLILPLVFIIRLCFVPYIAAVYRRFPICQFLFGNSILFHAVLHYNYR